MNNELRATKHSDILQYCRSQKVQQKAEQKHTRGCRVAEILTLPNVWIATSQCRNGQVLFF